MVGGLLIVAIGIPISMGMAEVAGLPPVVGLYSCLLAPVAFAVFGSSRQLVVALDASTAAVLAAAVTPLAMGDPVRHAALAGVLALAVGVVLVLAGLFRAGVIAAVLSHPVLLGYQAGLAIVVIASQLPRLLGVNVATDSTLVTLRDLVTHGGEVDAPTVLLGAACLAVIAFVAWRWPSLPGPLVAIALAGVVVASVGVFADVAVVGALPSGMPSFGLPEVAAGDVRLLAPAVLAIALIASADTIVSSRAFADRGGYEIDASRDMLGLGTANAASALSGGITISASAARTAVVEMVGVRSQMAGIAAAVLMAATLLFFTEPLANLPLAALGAVVIGAVARLIDLRGFRALWKIDRLECAVGVVTALAAIGLGLLEGIGVGVALSLCVLVARAPQPRARQVLGATVQRLPFDDLCVVRPLGSVVYLNATRVLDHLRSATADAGDTLVVDASRVGMVDATGALALAMFATAMERRNVDVVIAGLSPRSAAALERAGFWDGPEAFDRADDLDAALALVRTGEGEERAGRESNPQPSDP